ncbi:DUF86 domain-containing protein [candidate division KSB1 bacterium]|nr:DUF86 domain-containing protein [candidate division KSB1 bacterium]
MRNSEKIVRKLELLREYTRYLRSFQHKPIQEFSKDFVLQGALERYFQLAIECVIDIAHLIIADLKLKRPSSYREAIDILGQKRIIPDEFAYHFAPVTGFRNILIHGYSEIDMDEVYRHLQTDLDDFEKFSRYVVQFLEQN